MRVRTDRNRRETVEAGPDEEIRADLSAIAEVCRRAAAGDLEARIPPLDDETADGARRSINHLIDVTDAFVREAGASLKAASAGRFYRSFLEAGMPGSFRAGARTINTARDSMESAAAALEQEAATRAAVAETVLEVSANVAAASTQLSASAAMLNSSAEDAVSEATEALHIVERLEQSSVQIEQAVALIKSVARQTHLLALNATIEAARAGEMGRGFGVVASEVKHLAQETASASEEIVHQVEEARDAAEHAVAAINRMFGSVTDMGSQVRSIADAAGTAGTQDVAGLSPMAERLRLELANLVDSY